MSYLADGIAIGPPNHPRLPPEKLQHSIRPEDVPKEVTFQICLEKGRKLL